MDTAEFCISIYSRGNRVNLYYNGTEVTASAYTDIFMASSMSSNPVTITVWQKENGEWAKVSELDLSNEE